MLLQLPNSVPLEAGVCKTVLGVVPRGHWKACSPQLSNEYLSSELPVKHLFSPKIVKIPRIIYNRTLIVICITYISQNWGQDAVNCAFFVRLSGIQ